MRGPPRLDGSTSLGSLWKIKGDIGMPPGLGDPARIGKAILVSRKPPARRGVDEACDWAGLVDGDDNQGKT